MPSVVPDERMPVDHRPHRHRGAEAIRVADDPRGEHAAAGSAADEEVLRIDPALRDRRVDAGHQVVVVLVGIAVLDAVHELLAVAGRAARIRPQHRVAVGGEVLPRPVPADVVHAPRTAVNPQHHRVLLRRIEVRRLHQPALHLQAVLRREAQLFRVGERDARRARRVDVHEHARLGRPRQRERDELSGLLDARPHARRLAVLRERNRRQHVRRRW